MDERSRLEAACVIDHVVLYSASGQLSSGIPTVSRKVEYFMSDVWIALGLTVFAAWLRALAASSPSPPGAPTTGFWAGVMLYVSFVEIFCKGLDSLTQRYGDTLGVGSTSRPFSAASC